MGLCVSIRYWVWRVRVTDCNAARVGVLDDGDGRLGVVEGCAKGRIGVDVVVVRHFFAAEQASLRDAGGSLGRSVAVERCGLVRVFAVAQGVGQLGLKFEVAGKARVLALVVLGLAGVFAPLALDLTREPLGNGCVIARSVSEGVGGKFPALSQAGASGRDCRDDF